MKKQFILILVIPFLCVTHKTLLSSNYTHTADELHKICFGSINFEQQSYCLGFIIGTTDTLKRLNKICIPKAIKGDQIRDIVLSFFDKNNNMHNTSASQLISNSLDQKFQCTKKRK